MNRAIDDARHFFGVHATGIGIAALAALLGRDARRRAHGGLPGLPHFPPKAKRVIYLFQSGGPSQMELFDYKPRLTRVPGHRPAGVRAQGQRLTGMSATQSSFPGGALEVRLRAARQVGRLGQRTAAAHGEDRRRPDLHQVDEHRGDQPRSRRDHCCRPASQIAGRPSMGAWVSYGIGCETEDLPAFVRDDLARRGGGGQPLYDRLWGSGFLPSQYQGVKFRSVGRPGAVPVESRRASPPENRRDVSRRAEAS